MKNLVVSSGGTSIPARLIFHFLGDISVTLDSLPLKGKIHRKVMALLAYLAVESRKRHGREHLATLLWPELPLQDARTNLRQTLHYLRSALGPVANQTLFSSRESIQFLPGALCWIDCEALLSTVVDCEQCPAPEGLCTIACMERTKDGLMLYRDEFLLGFDLADAPEFERWRDRQRHALNGHAMLLAERLCVAHERHGDLFTAIHYAQQCVTLNPWNEVNHRRHMRLLSRSGQHAAVQTWYDGYREHLRIELDAKPEEATQALYCNLQKGNKGDADVTGQDDGVAQTRLRLGQRLATVVCCVIQPHDNSDPDEIEQFAEVKIACIETLQKHGAHVIQGHDGYLFAYLGYPHASEKAGDNAALAALAVKARFGTRYSFRAGIHTGIIVTSSDPAMPDLIGSTSGAALRLCQRARKGVILVNLATHFLLRERFDFNGPDASRHKGIALRDVAYSLRRKTDVKPQPSTRSKRVIGRKQELARLRAFWSHACQGRRHVVLLRGEAGIGKTRLLSALGDQVRQDGATVRELGCLPEHQHTPLYPLVALFASLCGFESTDSASVRQARVTMYLEQQHPELAARAAPILEALLNNRLPGNDTQPTRLRREETFEMMHALLDNLASRRPSLLIVEDIQWMDCYMQDLVQYVSSAPSSWPALIVLTTRHEADTDWLDPAAIIDLAPLTAKDITQLVKATRPQLRADVVKRIVSRAEGVPLYAEELALMAESSLETAEAIPPTLQYLLRARMDAVRPALHIMQQAATIGRYFDMDLLRNIVAVSETQLQKALQSLTQTQLISQRDAPFNDYQFHHALIHEAAYDSQIASERQRTHQSIAETLHHLFPLRAKQYPGQVARHYTAAGNLAAAIPWWVMAGEQALNLSAYNEAARYLRTGLDLLHDLQPNSARNALELSLLLPLGSALLALHGYGSSEAIAVYDNADRVGTAGTPLEQRFEITHGLWMVSSSRPGSSFLISEQLAQNLMRLALESGDPELLAEACAARTNIALWRNQPADAIHYGTQCLAQLSEAPVGVSHHDRLCPRVTSLAHMSWAWSRLGDPDKAKQASQSSLQFADALDRPNNQCFALFFAAMLDSFDGNIDAVKTYTDRLTTISDQYQMKLWQGGAAVLQGWIQAFEGDARGIDLIQQALSALQTIMPGVSTFAFYMQARACKQLGLYDDQQRVTRLGIQTARDVHEGFFHQALLELQAEQ